MTPDGLPTISAGAHDEEAGEACVMEYVSLLAGEDWSDRPTCTHPVLAHEARTVNDALPDADRGRLVPLVGRLLGSARHSDAIAARLRIRQAEQVMILVEPDARAPITAALEIARERLVDPSRGHDVAAAIEAARSLRPRGGLLPSEHEEYHVRSAKVMAFALAPDLGVAEAWALVALATAHAVAAADCRADCGDPIARARRGVKELFGLLDTYDEATGRHRTSTTPAQVEALVQAL